MSPTWTPDIHIDSAMAKTLIAAQFPALNPHEVELLGEGWDNAAFMVDNTVLFLFPRRDIAIPLLEAEIRLLPLLAPQVSLEIPVPKYVGRATETYPACFMGYPLVPGIQGCEAAPGDESRAAFAPQLGRFLKELHALTDLGRKANLPLDTFRRTVPERVLERLTKHMQPCKQLMPADEIARLAALRDQLAGELAGYRPAALVLAHGDLYISHLMLNDSRELCGVIDWGDTHLGDPAVDLTVAWTALPKSAHESFREAYGTIDPTTWTMAKLRAMMYGFVLLDYGSNAHKPNLAREGRWILSRLR